MATKTKAKSDFDALRDEASKVIDDLSQLGKVLGQIGEEKSKDAKEDLDAFFQTEIANIKKRLEGLSGKIGESAQTADKHVRANPYLYILGALGIGYILGKLLTRQSRD